MAKIGRRGRWPRKLMCHVCGLLFDAYNQQDLDRGVCAECQMDGAGWTVVYDRASGTGALPASLRAREGEAIAASGPGSLAARRAEMVERLHQLELNERE